MLQLDIVGGYYDPVTETIISSGPNFTLVALLTPQNNTSTDGLNALLNETYYISAAVNPPVGPAPSTLGSFSFNTVNYNITSDLTYGTPPIELFTAANPDVPPSGDLQTHSIFPTYFGEFSFQFSSTQRTLTYNTAEDPGGFVALPTTAVVDPNLVSYYQTFNITTALLGSDTAIHFDLYSTFVRNCALSGACTWDEDVALNAPFSHDAQSSSSVPEPQTLMVMSTGLLLAGRLLARRRQVQ